MGTLVCFHAHPDDEAIATGGVMAMAAEAGHRVVLVVATKGEVGEVDEGVLDEGETLGERRVKETHVAAEVLGAHRVAFLGYEDSGMVDEPTNANPKCFWQADVDEAAARLAEILVEEDAEALTIYDDHGNYGHPDHIQVHRVGVVAAEKVGTPRVYEATMNRDHIRRMMEIAREHGEVPDGPDVDGEESNFGLPEAELTTGVDVSAYVDRKRAAMIAHASQIGEESFFLQMPEEQFALVFGKEWFKRRGVPAGLSETTLFP